MYVSMYACMYMYVYTHIQSTYSGYALAQGRRLHLHLGATRAPGDLPAQVDLFLVAVLIVYCLQITD